MPLSPEQEFINIALKEFDFLVKDFCFIATPNAFFGEGLSFANETLALKIDLGWYKGEISVDFELSLENHVFRPYISRRFALHEIERFINRNGIAKVLSDAPSLPKWVLNTQDAQIVLRHDAMRVQQFCCPILKGDFRVLEVITWARRRDQGQTELERYGKSGPPAR